MTLRELARLTDSRDQAHPTSRASDGGRRDVKSAEVGHSRPTATASVPVPNSIGAGMPASGKSGFA